MELTLDLSQNYIGGGGNWKVYECDLIGRNDNPVILKTTDNVSESKVDINIANYQHVRSLGLPTLQIFEKCKLNGNWAILAEHLNKTGEILYVSPNSVKTEAQQLMDLLENHVKHSCKAEQYLYENKLSTIRNLPVLVRQHRDALRYIRRDKVFLYSDCYFFGVSGQGELRYVIADFDNISIEKNTSANAVYNANIAQFENALVQFIEHFVVKNSRSELTAHLKALLAADLPFIT